MDKPKRKRKFGLYIPLRSYDIEFYKARPRQPSAWRPYLSLISLIGIALFAFCAWGVVIYKSEMYYYETSYKGGATTATVTRCHDKTTPKSSLMLDYTYQVQANLYKASAAVSGDSCSVYAAGTSLDVFYNISDPAASRLAQTIESPVLRCVLYVIITFIMLMATRERLETVRMNLRTRRVKTRPPL